MAQVTAPYPFDNHDRTSDLTLRSSDNILFHVHKSTLIVASPRFFGTDLMRSQPQGLPVSMDEDSGIFDTILRFCYPVEDPSFQSLAELHRVVERMSVLDMVDVSKRARVQIRNFANVEPLLAFIIAYSFNWNDEAMEASDIVLNGPLFTQGSPDDIPELDDLLYPRILYRLFRCHATRCDAVYNASSGSFFGIYDYIEKAPCKTHDILPAHPEGISMPTKSWFIDYCSKLQEELYRHPSLETLRTCDDFARPSALRTATECHNCAQGDLQGIFSHYIPSTVHAHIRNALSMVSPFLVEVRRILELINVTEISIMRTGRPQIYVTYIEDIYSNTMICLFPGILSFLSSSSSKDTYL